MALYQQGAVAEAASALPCQGVSIEINVTNLNGTQPTYTSINLDNGMWAQIGYTGGNADGHLTPFFQVWDLNNGPSLMKASNNNLKTDPGWHEFEISLKNGTTWQFLVDDRRIGQYDMGTATSAALGRLFAGTEFDSVIPDTIEFRNWQTLQEGVWDPVEHATSFGNHVGIIGNLQDPTIAVGEFWMGSDLAITPEYSWLW